MNLCCPSARICVYMKEETEWKEEILMVVVMDLTFSVCKNIFYVNTFLKGHSQVLERGPHKCGPRSLSFIIFIVNLPLLIWIDDSSNPSPSMLVRGWHFLSPVTTTLEILFRSHNLSLCLKIPVFHWCCFIPLISSTSPSLKRPPLCFKKWEYANNLALGTRWS